MDSFLFRFRNSLVLVLLLVAQTIGLAIQVRRPAGFSRKAASVGSVLPGAELSPTRTESADAQGVVGARSWVVAVVSPVERLVHNSGLLVRSMWANYIDLRHARAENAELERDLAQLRIEQASVAEDAVQGHRLQALLKFQQQYVGSTVAAQVIGTSGSELSRVVYLDKGAADGLRPDMAVITPDGIVGKVREVFPAVAPHTAQVLLISDQTSGAGVILEKTRIRAVLRGTTGGELQIANLTDDDHLKQGDAVITSGGDGIFPRGLPVGTIAEVVPDPNNVPYRTGRVKAAANLSRLEEVLVVTSTAGALPPATLGALTKGAAETAQARAVAVKLAAAQAAAAEAAREEAARSAADVVADRLPSIRDPNAPKDSKGDGDAAAAGKLPADAKSPAVPKPLPTVHPDRYSPGAAPAASGLQPGAPRRSSDTGTAPRTPEAPQ